MLLLLPAVMIISSVGLVSVVLPKHVPPSFLVTAAIGYADQGECQGWEDDDASMRVEMVTRQKERQRRSEHCLRILAFLLCLARFIAAADWFHPVLTGFTSTATAHGYLFPFALGSRYTHITNC